MDLLPADIEIESDELGRPIVGGAWIGSIDATPLVSLAHTRGMAVAVAALSGASSPVEVEPGIGIDIEYLRPRPEGFEEIAFSETERALLAGLPEDLAEEWTLRCWCAKEAVAKSTGAGLADGPRSVSVIDLDMDNERVVVRPGETLKRVRADLAIEDIAAYTTRWQDLIAAVAVNEAFNK